MDGVFRCAVFALKDNIKKSSHEAVHQFPVNFVAQVFRSHMKSNLHIPDIAQCQHREVEKEGMPV